MRSGNRHICGVLSKKLLVRGFGVVAIRHLVDLLDLISFACDVRKRLAKYTEAVVSDARV